MLKMNSELDRRCKLAVRRNAIKFKAMSVVSEVRIERFGQSKVVPRVFVLFSDESFFFAIFLGSGNGMIEFKNISKTFETDDGPVRAVQNVNLRINDGEVFGIVGFSGAGKSTLVRMLNGLETPTSGEVIINGKKINGLKGAELREQRKKIGTIFQHFNLLWSRTVLQNIEFPLELAGVDKKTREKKAKHLAEVVGLGDRIHAYPAQLSGGQKQRVGIARALANDPDILISDEATSALDPQTTDEVLDLLERIN